MPAGTKAAVSQAHPRLSPALRPHTTALRGLPPRARAAALSQAGTDGCQGKPYPLRRQQKVCARLLRHSLPAEGPQEADINPRPHRTGPPGGAGASRRAPSQPAPTAPAVGSAEKVRARSPGVPYLPAAAAARTHSSPDPPPHCHPAPLPPSLPLRRLTPDKAPHGRAAERPLLQRRTQRPRRGSAGTAPGAGPGQPPAVSVGVFNRGRRRSTARI